MKNRQGLPQILAGVVVWILFIHTTYLNFQLFYSALVWSYIHLVKNVQTIQFKKKRKKKDEAPFCFLFQHFVRLNRVDQVWRSSTHHRPKHRNEPAENSCIKQPAAVWKPGHPICIREVKCVNWMHHCAQSAPSSNLLKLLTLLTHSMKHEKQK